MKKNIYPRLIKYTTTIKTVIILLAIHSYLVIYSQSQSSTLPCFVNAECGSVPISTEYSLCQLYPLPEEYFTITEDKTVSSLGQALFENEYILIEGNFIVDETVVFRNCTIRVAPNAVIETEGASGIYFFQCNIFSCGGLWDGLEINNSGWVYLIGSTISEARYAVNLKNGYSVTRTRITGTNFIRNEYGLHVATSFSPNYNKISVALATFYGNVFDGSRAYIYPGNTTLIVPRRAIYLFGVSGLIGGTLSPKNDIKNYPIGMEVARSNITITNIEFHDMYYDVNSTLSEYEGIGIFATGNSFIRTSGNINSNGCEFYDCCRKGVWARACDVDIKNAKYYGMYREGIHSDLNNQKQIRIHNNDLECEPTSIPIRVDRGIHLTPDVENYISSNKFDLNTPRVGVWVQDLASASALDYFSVSNNIDFSIHNGRHGIQILGKTVDDGNESINFGISGNIISCTGTFYDLYGTGFAISQIGCDGDLKTYKNYINSNKVSSPEADLNSMFCNFHIESTRNITVCDNQSEGGFRGFHFMGNSDKSFFSNNIIGLNQIGLHISRLGCNGEVGAMGDQVRRGNYWELEDYSTGSISDICNYGGQYAARLNSPEDFSIFKCESTDYHTLPTDRYPTSNSNWFSYEDGELDECGSGFGGGGGEPSKLDRTFATDGIDSVFNSEASLWENSISLLIQTLKNSEYLQDTLVDNFYDSHESTVSSSWLFANAEYAFSEGMFVPDSIYEIAYSLLEDINVINKNVDSLAALVTDTTSYWDFVIDQIDSINNVLTVKSSQKDSVAGLISAFRQSALLSVKSQMQALPDTAAYEYNRKFLDIWYVRHMLGDTLDVLTLDTLRIIAAQNSLSGGSAIFDAIRLLPDCEQEQYESGESDFGSFEDESFVTSYKPQNLHEKKCLVSPNPSNGQFYLELVNIDAGNWFIKDMSGKIIREGKFQTSHDGDKIQIDILAADPGIYIFYLISDKHLFSQKIAKF